MNKSKKHSSGFAVPEAILILVIIILIGTVGWMVYKNHNKNSSAVTNSSISPTKNATPITVKLDKTYTDEVGSFSVNYPSTWAILTKIDNSDPQYRTSATTLTSPSGTVLNLKADWGGRGGACIPNAQDVAFKAGNNCQSYEYLSSKVLPIKNVYYAASSTSSTGNITTTYKPADIVLVTIHYADPSGTSSYLLGLDESTQPNPIILNTPKMGMFISEISFTVYGANGQSHPYIYAYASGSTASFLTSADASTIRAILNTMKFNI
jgi:hypothetical protein